MMAVSLFRDLGLKVLATALAVLLWWLTVGGDPVAERGLRVPLEFENVPASVEILGELPDEVEVRLRGPSAVLRRLEAGEVTAIIDLKSERLGPRLFDMTADRVRGAPPGVRVTQVIPSTVSLTLEDAGTPRVVPVVPVVEGEPAPGFVVGRVVADPSTVAVVGPLSLLRQLTEAITEPLDVTNASVPLEESLTVGLADPNLRLETPGAARVTVEIVRAPVERTLVEVPVRVRNAPSGLSARVTPESITVTVYGPPEQMRGLDSSMVGAFVDLAGREAGSYNLSVEFAPQRAFEVTQVEPTIVLVTLR
jgi:YbbR domain-containing protein